ncbi:MAG: hypothetical protein ACI80V_003345 [Rhodothermales bacterium]|jgi:hypothetical protein
MTKRFADSVRKVESRILLIRGAKVLIDADLAELYGVSTKRLNEQVTRNSDRFPEDFVFRLTRREKEEVVANCDHLSNLKYSPAMPRAFTEHGAIMVASVLKSDVAVQMSVFVVRAFVRLRQVLMESETLGRRLEAVEKRLSTHYSEIRALVSAVRRLLGPSPVPLKRQIGFRIDHS